MSHIPYPHHKILLPYTILEHHSTLISFHFPLSFFSTVVIRSSSFNNMDSFRSFTITHIIIPSILCQNNTLITLLLLCFSWLWCVFSFFHNVTNKRKKALQPVMVIIYHYKPEGCFLLFLYTFLLSFHPHFALRANRLFHICMISAF